MPRSGIRAQGRPPLNAVCWGLLFGMGLATGGVFTYLGPMAVARFGASPFLVGLLFAVSAAAGVVAGPLAGLLTDRIGGRKGVVVAGLALAGLGTAALGPSAGAPAMLAAMLAASVGGVAMPLLLAFVGDAAREADGAPPHSGATMLVRMGFALGFAAGAPLGGLAIQSWGYAAPAVGAGLGQLALACIALLALPAVRRAPPAAAGPAPRILSLPLLLFCLSGVLVMMAEQAKSQFLPLRLTQQVHLPPEEVGLLFGVQAALELILMPLAGKLADRLGLAPALALTFLLPVPYLLGVSLATSLPLLVALQLLEAGAVAGFSGLAYVQAQRLAPGREGFGITLYSSGFGAARLLTGLLVGGAAQVAGLAAGLQAGALAALLGWLLLLATFRLGTSATRPRASGRAVAGVAGPGR